MAERTQQGPSTFAGRAYPFDWIILGYCFLMLLLILAFGRPVADYTHSLLFYAGVAVVTTLIVRFTHEGSNRWSSFVRLLYPALLFTFFYRETGSLMLLFFDSFFDWQIVAFERAILGVNPTLYIDHQWLNVWLNEVFSAGYFSYYLIIPGFLIPVFVLREYDLIKRFNAAACIMFFLSYLLFSLYPVEGPRWYFAHQYLHSVDGPFFRQIVEFVIDKGAVRGGAMPSSHTGIAMVIMFFLMKYHRSWGRGLIPIVVLLSIGTFWGRFHYISDVAVGAAIAVFATWLVFTRHDRWTAGPIDARIADRRTQHVA